MGTVAVDLLRRDYVEAQPERSPLTGVEHFRLWYGLLEGRTPTISAFRRELHEQGALVGSDEIFDASLPLDFAKDAPRIHHQCLNTCDGWIVSEQNIRGSLEVLREQPLTLEDESDRRAWRLFVDQFLPSCAEHGGFVVA